MDRELWASLLRAIRRAAAALGPHVGQRPPTYADWLIVAMYVWSVWHDRPLCWACRRDSYHGAFRPRRLPSASRFTRRVRSDRCQRILQRVHEAFATRPSQVAIVDAKPLPVSPVSKDPDAARGKVSGGFARGYKLHALVDAGRRIAAWSVMGLNVDEKTVAREALLPRVPAGALVLADSNYDSAPLHREVVEPLGICFVHPLRGQHRAGGANRELKLRQMPTSRRALVRAWEGHPDLARYVLKLRNAIESVFGVLTCTAGGLAGLPAWVRRLGRVRRWVGVKIVLYNARLAVRDAHRSSAIT